MIGDNKNVVRLRLPEYIVVGVIKRLERIESPLLFYGIGDTARWVDKASGKEYS